MIEFHCEHCDTSLRLDDEFAGRDGWCRVCKRMVIVPDGDSAPRVSDLPPEEGYTRLQQLLSYAATKADKYKQRVARDRRDEEKLRKAEDELLAVKTELDEMRTRLGDLMGKVDEESSQHDLRQELQHEYELLQQKQAVSEAARADLEAERATWEDDRAALKEQIEDLTAGLERAHSKENELSVALARLDAGTVAKLDEAHAAIEILQKDLRQEAERVGELTVQLAAKTSECESIQAQATASGNVATSLEAALEEERNLREQFENEIAPLKAAKGSQATASAAHEAELNKAREQCRHAEELATSLRSTLSQFQLEAEEAARTNTTQKQDNAVLAAQYEALLTAHEDLLARHESLEQEQKELELALEFQSRTPAREALDAEADKAAEQYGGSDSDAFDEDLDDALQVEVSRIQHPDSETPSSDPKTHRNQEADIDTAFKAYIARNQEGNRDEVMSAFMRFLDQ